MDSRMPSVPSPSASKRPLRAGERARSCPRHPPRRWPPNERCEMRQWPRHPLIYEVNAWAWLNELSQKQGGIVDLATVPEHEWQGPPPRGFLAVWRMGGWGEG